MSNTSYHEWSHQDLVARILKLEASKPPARPPSPKPMKPYPTRKIALKFCYAGWEYNGLAFQSGYTPLPTVEGTLYDAMALTRLVDPSKGFDGCGWEKCGRTDRGVSAAGQVISLNIRSAIGSSPESSEDEGGFSGDNSDEPNLDTGLPSLSPVSRGKKPKRERELPYVSILNRVLPPTIRVIAWSPVSDSFSARFNCKYRHYKYFFSSTTPSGQSLDIEAMRDAASRLVGEQDFRNMCKLDPAKQITNFVRKVLRADISPSSPDSPTEWVLDLIGTAFLYHQVRHIMAVLFMVGSGLEKPDIVDKLLQLECKPEYQMADALPLMLWDCAYDDADVSWRTTNAEGDEVIEASGVGAHLYEQLHGLYARSSTHAVLDRHFLEAIAQKHGPPDGQGPLRVPLGGGTYKRMAKYVPLLQRKRLEKYEAANERWRKGKGARKVERNRDLEGDDMDE